MKTIIAEKPSVAREIARIVGATKKEDGFLSGNGYRVTWAFGHLVQLAMPDAYGVRGFNGGNLPIIPEEFILLPRQAKTDMGYKPDSGVMAQINVIRRLFNDSERIIVATDAGREGELIFRYLYEYVGCNVPFDRLWISSLTDTAIREGLNNLRNGGDYDNLYHAARARSEADWLVGINGTQALSVAAGRGTYSVGRVQTPTLAMVCSRYWENRRFEPRPYWQVLFGVKGDKGEFLKFTSTERWEDKVTAENIYNRVNESRRATITKVECKTVSQEPPLLYDLTALQKDCNHKHGFTADQTLKIAQKLYEAKLITYPRTSSRHITEDVFDTVPTLIETQKEHETFGKHISNMDKLNRHSVDASKVTDHHALLITVNKPIGLYKNERIVYDMILGRMIEAFSDRNITEKTEIIATCGGAEFTTNGSVTRQAGWKAVYSEGMEDTVLPNWKQGTELHVSGVTLTSGKTKPKLLHTEATLLAAMETAGNDIEDEKMRQAMKDCSIGTPATRAAIIETLLKREYIIRSGKSLVPTEKGLALYSVVKGMDIANVELTGKWEAELARIEHGKLTAETFMDGIKEYTKAVTTELLSCDKLFSHKERGCACPKCKQGTMRFYGKVVRCDDPGCALPVFRQIAGKTLTDDEMMELLTTGRTATLKGFRSRHGNAFSASVALAPDFSMRFVFSDAANMSNGTRNGASGTRQHGKA